MIQIQHTLYLYISLDFVSHKLFLHYLINIKLSKLEKSGLIYGYMNADFKKMSVTTRNTRTKVYCFCKKCNGSLANPRTRNDHHEDYQKAGPFANFHSNNNNRDNNEMEYKIMKGTTMKWDTIIKWDTIM